MVAHHELEEAWAKWKVDPAPWQKRFASGGILLGFPHVPKQLVSFWCKGACTDNWNHCVGVGSITSRWMALANDK